MNYKKWDTLAAELSDSDDENHKKVRVTRLDRPSQVTIGKDRTITISQSEGKIDHTQPSKSKSLDYSKWDRFASKVSDSEDDEENEDEEDDMNIDNDVKRQDIPASPLKTESKLDQDQQRSSKDPIEVLTRNGGTTHEYMWSQDKKEVVLCIFLPPSAKARDVRLSIKDQQLKIELKAGAGWVNHLDKRLLYPVEGMGAAQEDLDWQLLDDPRPPVAAAAAAASVGSQSASAERGRLLRVCVRKALTATASEDMPVEHSVTLWWKGVFVGDAVIDVAAIPVPPPN